MEGKLEQYIRNSELTSFEEYGDGCFKMKRMMTNGDSFTYGRRFTWMAGYVDLFHMIIDQEKAIRVIKDENKLKITLIDADDEEFQYDEPEAVEKAESLMLAARSKIEDSYLTGKKNYDILSQVPEDIGEVVDYSPSIVTFQSDDWKIYYHKCGHSYLEVSTTIKNKDFTIRLNETIEGEKEGMYELTFAWEKLGYHCGKWTYPLDYYTPEEIEKVFCNFWALLGQAEKVFKGFEQERAHDKEILRERERKQREPDRRKLLEEFLAL